MLLEEAILRLLRSSGYRTIDVEIGDPTLSKAGAGIEVHGRGANHQIDAIADFQIHQPFSNPARLLLEAKFTDHKTGINVVRNAVGVIRDVSEYWIGGSQDAQKGTTRGSRTRFHYQYAIFSASSFTPRAQDYAFAHDIYLLPLNESRFLVPVLDAVHRFAEQVANQESVEPLGDLRKRVRARLRGDGVEPIVRRDDVEQAESAFIEAVRRIGTALLAMLGNQFPVFLVPDSHLRLVTQLNTRRPIRVRIYWDNHGWYLRSAEANEQKLFSFQLPKELFLNYAKGDLLTPEDAVRLKGEQLSQFQAFYIRDGRPLLLTFELDYGWLEEVKARLHWQGPDMRPA